MPSLAPRSHPNTNRTTRSTSISSTHFLGHSFGIIPAPGVLASSACQVPPCKSFGSLPECSRSTWEQYPLALECPKKMGQKWRFFSYVSQSRPINWLPRERPGEAPSARKRRHLHGSLGRHPTVVEGLERRVAVENRVAPRSRVQPSRNGDRRHSSQGRPRSCRWDARQFEV